MRTFKLPAHLAADIIRQAKDEHPNESCGLLAGYSDGGSGEASRIFPMTNAERSPVLYRMEPTEQLRVFNEIDKDDLDLVAIYHSHTRSPAYPSSTDVNLAYYPEAVYLIVSLRNMDAPELRGFDITDGKVTEVELEIG